MVKGIYKQLKLESVYEEQEEKRYAECVALIEKYKNILPAESFMRLLKRLHKRDK